MSQGKQKAYIVYQPTAWSGDILAALIREDGICLAQHLCSGPGFAPGDLWIRRKERKEKWADLEVDLEPMEISHFRKKYPTVFDLAFIVSKEEVEP